MRKWICVGLLLTGCFSQELTYDWKSYPVGDTLKCEFPVAPVAAPQQVEFYVKGYALEKGHKEKIPAQTAAAGVPPTMMPQLSATEFTIPEKSAEDPKAGLDWLRARTGEDDRHTVVQVGADEAVEGLGGLKGIAYAYQYQSSGEVVHFRIFAKGTKVYQLSVTQKKGSEKAEMEKKFFDSAKI